MSDSGAPVQPVQSFRFTGTGGEYFRIWIVNLCLSVVTLGIYSAWAKVQRLQYFYRHTSVAGSSFDYHGNPVAILKGRIIAFVLFMAYSLSGEVSPLLQVATFAVLAVVMPWLIQRSLCFRLHYSSWRGLRFAFRGTVRDAYSAYLLWPMLAAFTLYLLAPLAHQRIKEFQINNSRFGDADFRFQGDTGQFYILYLLSLLIVVLGVIVIVAPLVVLVIALFKWQALGGGGSDRAGFMIAMVAMMVIWLGVLFSIYVVAWPFYTARLQNMLWNNTFLGAHRFACDMKMGKLLGLHLTNILGIIFTLGLFKPFADIRMARYRIESLSLLPADDLESFVARQEQEVAAMGDEMTEMFDIDIGM